ncbi:MAG: DNA-processing protein DprA [Brevinema sp.]
MDKRLFSLVAFSATDLIGSNRYEKIKKHFPNLEDFLDCDLEFQYNFLNLKNEHSKKTLSKMKDLASFVLDTCAKKQIQLIDEDHEDFPESLRNISSPPYLLFVQGKLHPKVPLMGVIGTRRATPDSIKINEHFCETFVEYGLGVVSGLADGHDSIAARSVLKKEGYTIGVLGTAIDVVYPTKNKKLYDEIKEVGAIVSEYPPGIASTKWRFPRRNRIVSGMSEAVLVVQAPEKSGTLITVQMAIDQQKDVYVVPGNPLFKEYKGSNSLIQQGAKIALDPLEIVKSVLKENPNVMKIERVAKKSTPPPSPKIDPNLPPEQQKILELTGEDMHFDEIAEAMQINISNLTAILTMMEIGGLITQKPGQIYKRSHYVL